MVECWLNSVAASFSLIPLLAVASDQPHKITGIGIVVRGGVECPHVALEDGKVYALDGRLPASEVLQLGTRVRITGVIAPNSKCGVLPPIAVDTMQILIDGSPDLLRQGK